MSTALQAFQYKRKLNKAIKHVQAPFMGKNKSSAKQESSSWINSITGKKHDDAKREVDVNHQDSKQKSFLPWHKQNVEEEGPQASPDNDQPESSELVAVKDGGMHSLSDEIVTSATMARRQTKSRLRHLIMTRRKAPQSRKKRRKTMMMTGGWMTMIVKVRMTLMSRLITKRSFPTKMNPNTTQEQKPSMQRQVEEVVLGGSNVIR